MKIVCDSCGAKYSIADEKVAGKIFKIRCKKCSSVLEVRGDRTGANAVEDPNAGQPSAGEATWYVVVDGEQKGPLAPIDLSQLFAKGSVGLGSYVWAEGFDDWKVASEVPELAQLLGGGTSQPGADAGADNTSAFAAGRDLFGGGDREPTAEIDTNSSMFAGFEDNPTPAPTAANESPLAAAAQAAGESMAGGAMGGGAAAASGAQRMTGQRNENSVLFSLSNLQQLASRSGAEAEPAAAQAPAATASPQGAPPTTGEGSGLIDIRALARSTGPGNAAAPAQAVDDLLAIGTGGGAALGGPLLGPAPEDTSDGNRWLWIGGVAIAVIAIVGAGVWVGTVVGGSEDEALEITAQAGTAPSEASPGSSAVAAAAATATEAPSEPLAAAQPADIVPIEDNPPEEAPQLKAPAPAKRASATTQRRPRASKSTSATSSKPAPAPAKRSGNNLDALMDEVVGGSSSASKPKARSTSSASSSNLPDAPSRNDVKTALQGVSGAVKACRKDAGGTATVDVTFSGKTGRATGAKVTSGPFKGTPVGSCIQTAVKRARVPRFKQSSFKVTFPYRL